MIVIMHFRGYSPIVRDTLIAGGTLIPNGEGYSNYFGGYLDTFIAGGILSSGTTPNISEGTLMLSLREILLLLRGYPYSAG